MVDLDCVSGPYSVSSYKSKLDKPYLIISDLSD